MNIETWTPLIRNKASKIYRSFNGAVEYEDCLQQGYEIFCKALHSFDPDKGAAFGTWLYWQLERLRKDVAKTLPTPGSPEAFDYAIEPTPLWKESVFLSKDAQLVLKLLLERKLHRHSEGPGRVLPGEKTVRNYMKIHYNWKKNHSQKVWDELKLWFRSIQ